MKWKTKAILVAALLVVAARPDAGATRLLARGWDGSPPRCSIVARIIISPGSPRVLAANVRIGATETTARPLLVLGFGVGEQRVRDGDIVEITGDPLAAVPVRLASFREQMDLRSRVLARRCGPTASAAFPVVVDPVLR